MTVKSLNRVENIVANREIAISLFATMFSSLFNNYTRDFPNVLP